MAEKEHDLDGLFRSKLKDLEADPLPSSWDKIHGALQVPTQVPAPKPSFVHKYWLAAALGMVVLTATWVSYQAFRTAQYQEEPAQVTDLGVEQRKVEGLQKVDANNRSNGLQSQSDDLQPSKEMVYTAKDTLKKVSLPDGTVVTLHKNTTLVLDPNFPETRSVDLTGKAFFEVKQGQHPFVVRTAEVQLRLKEAAFMLASQPDITLFVKSGAVSLSLKQAEQVVNAGEKTVVSKDKIGKVTPIVSPNYLSWQTGKLTFDNTKLDQVVSDIESYYGVGIALDNEGLRNCRFTGVFEKTSLEEVLQVLSVSFDLKYNQKASRYTIQGAGCK